MGIRGYRPGTRFSQCTGHTLDEQRGASRRDQRHAAGARFISPPSRPTATDIRRPAVIAIENARQFNETKEALARQTATSDILRVISRSPTDVQPVFDAIVLAAVRLIHCDMAFFLRCNATTYTQRQRPHRRGYRQPPRSSGRYRSRRQLPVACDRGKGNAALAGLVADGPA